MLTVLRLVQVNQYCNAAYKPDTRVFLSVKDAGKTEVVSGLY